MVRVGRQQVTIITGLVPELGCCSMHQSRRARHRHTVPCHTPYYTRRAHTLSVAAMPSTDCSHRLSFSRFLSNWPWCEFCLGLYFVSPNMMHRQNLVSKQDGVLPIDLLARVRVSPPRLCLPRISLITPNLPCAAQQKTFQHSRKHVTQDNTLTHRTFITIIFVDLVLVKPGVVRVGNRWCVSTMFSLEDNDYHVQ